MKILNRGKLRTTAEQNTTLQERFLEKGYKFANGSNEVKKRDKLDYFYFDNGIISLGSKSDIYSNRNVFAIKFYNGEVHFNKQKLKEYKFEDLIKMI